MGRSLKRRVRKTRRAKNEGSAKVIGTLDHGLIQIRLI